MQSLLMGHISHFGFFASHIVYPKPTKTSFAFFHSLLGRASSKNYEVLVGLTVEHHFNLFGIR